MTGFTTINKKKTHSSMKILKIMRSIEAQDESAFQSILTMVFLIKTNFAIGEFDSYKDINLSLMIPVIAILSFVFSFWSFYSTIIFLDFDNLQANAQTLTHNKDYFKFSEINGWYIYHILWRFMEVVCSILIFSLIWVILGGHGMWLAIFVVTLYLWLIIQCKCIGCGFVLYQKYFLRQLMLFDIYEICVVFNLHKYIPYSKMHSHRVRFFSFLVLGCCSPIHDFCDHCCVYC